MVENKNGLAPNATLNLPGRTVVLALRADMGYLSPLCHRLSNTSLSRITGGR